MHSLMQTALSDLFDTNKQIERLRDGQSVEGIVVSRNLTIAANSSSAFRHDLVQNLKV